MRPKTRKLILLLLSGVILFGATTRLEPLNLQREEHQLVLPPLPDEMAPSMLLTPLLALGRAPLVDVLWMRATKLKEEGRFFDALQLSERICQLQPKFASVWAFQAWNMSYNISVTFKSPEERWRWVRNGYELLRDKGIPLNPNNTQLYRELAWILFHKVGDFMDDWHYYYKLQFALEMEDILGTPPADYVKPGQVRGDFYRNYDFQSLAEVPKRFVDLLSEPAIAKFVEELRRFGFDPAEPGVYLKIVDGEREGILAMPGTPDKEQENRKEAFFRFFRDDEGKRYTASPPAFSTIGPKMHVRRFVDAIRPFGIDLATAEGHASLAAILRGDELMPEVPADAHESELAKLMKVLDAGLHERARVEVDELWIAHQRPPPTKDVRVVLEHYWRADRLRTEVKLEPARIVEVEDVLGLSMDWRLAISHALYWANLGLELGTDKRMQVDIHKLNTQRIEFYCLQKMYHRGRLAMSPEAKQGEPPLLSEDLRAIPVLFEAFQRDSAEYLKDENVDKAVSENFRTGFVGFTRSAILAYHEFGFDEEAEEMLAFIREAFPDPMYEGGMDFFLSEQLKMDRDFPDHRRSVRLIRALIAKGIENYAYMEDERANLYILRSRDVYNKYQKSQVSNRNKIPYAFLEIVQGMMNEAGSRFNRRETYLRICEKLGVNPLPETPEESVSSQG